MARVWARVVGASLLVLVAALSGCGTGETEDLAGGADDDTIEIRIGIQPITAALPVLVAEEEGLFEEAGLDATIEVFQSGADRNAAISADAIDCTIGDPVGLALLEAGGHPVSATRVMLGCTPEEGPDGIVAGPGVEAESLEDLVGVPVGTSLRTHQEYIVDALFAQAGFAREDVVKEEVKKTPIRYELLMEGQIQAAAFCEPWLTLAQENGATLVVDDTQGENLSQELLFASDEWLATEEGAEAMTRLLDVLDEAVTLIEEDPTACLPLLVEHSCVPEELSDIFVVDHFSATMTPTEQMLAGQLEWMVETGLLDETIPIGDLVWEPTG